MDEYAAYHAEQFQTFVTTRQDEINFRRVIQEVGNYNNSLAGLRSFYWDVA